MEHLDQVHGNREGCTIRQENMENAMRLIEASPLRVRTRSKCSLRPLSGSEKLSEYLRVG